MTTGFSPPPMPDDTLDLSAIPDDSAEAEDGWAKWLGEKPRGGRTAIAVVRPLSQMGPAEPTGGDSSYTAARIRAPVVGADSPGSDVDILLAQLAWEEAQAEALKARRLAEERDMAVRLSQTRLKVAEARRSHENSR